MRRVLYALLTGGALLTATACGTAPNSPGTAPAAPPSTPAAGAACEALAQVYDKNMGSYAKALTALAADPKTIAQAQQSLAAFATAVQGATETSADTQLQAAGKQAAKQMHDKSTDAKFFATIKTTEDVTEAIGPTLSEWLSPVQRHCS
ncbi:hypothetical protein [Actinoplanes sp. CA-252034]|uniref:hypothetical protein n=1 Tax=Actinoplanes sp. CA-252034 TaxID=3239906 RepID=UPI003D9787D3